MEQTSPEIKRPALRYRGGKWMLGPWIVGHIPPHECFVETHCGGASVLLRKPPSDFEVINDMDDEIVNFWQVLRDRTDEFLQAVELTPWAREEQLLAYEIATDPLERARRFYVRCWQGRGNSAERSGWRFQRAWNGWRHNKPLDFKKLEHLEAIAARLATVQIENRDAVKLIETWDAPGVLFYVDPPYVHDTRSQNRQLYRLEMDDQAHTDLANALNDAAGMVMISGYESELYNDLFKGWAKSSRVVAGEMTAPKTECLWLSPNAQAALEGQPPGPLFAGVIP